MRKVITILIAIVIIAGATFGVYGWQSKKIDSLQKQQTVLKQEVSSLQSQYEVAKAAANVSTASWKKYCDQNSPFCFNYPSQWKIADGSFNAAGDKRIAASLSDPSNTLRISYANPLIKDGGSSSVRIVKVNQITVGGTKLAVLGIVPVSSGIYSPAYILLGTDQALSTTPSDKVLLLNGSDNPRFSIGKYNSIQFTGASSGQKITSYDQAKAWFDSVDGNTVLKVLESLSASTQ